MKKFVVFISLLACQAFSAELVLNGGESAIIQPNVATKVTCGGSSSGMSCTDPIKGLTTLIDACKSVHNAAYCADKYWPGFKENNPQCVYAALNICIDNCKTVHNAAYCADRCNN